MRAYGWALAALLLVAGEARAGIYLDATLMGVPLEVEAYAADPRLSIRIEDRRYLAHAEEGWILEASGDRAGRRVEPRAFDDGADIPWRVARWSHGPSRAGHRSDYNVITVDGVTCGESLTSAWMANFVEPLVRAIELAQSIDPRLRPRAGEPPCGPTPFRVWAAKGWPLMAGKLSDVAFDTHEIRFDHRPDRALFALAPRD